MPKVSPYQLFLTEREIKVLKETAARYTLPYFQVIRAKMILLAAEGASNKEIAQQLDVRRETVSKWRKRFFEERLAGLLEQPRPGRPAAFPPQIAVQVKALACELPRKQGYPFPGSATET